MNTQHELVEQAGYIIEDLEEVSSLRGVTAYWEGETAIITFYFEGEPTEDAVDLASCWCGELIAHFPSGLLAEKFEKWDSSQALPDSPYWVWRR